MTKSQTIIGQQSQEGFFLNYRKKFLLSGSQERIEAFMDLCRNLHSTQFTLDKIWTMRRALYMDIDKERLVCLRTKGRNLPKAHLILVTTGEFVRISDITKDYATLDCDDYNLVVEAFVNEYLTAEVRRYVKTEFWDEYDSLDSVMSKEAAEALEVWCDSCCIDSNYNVTCDMQLWQKAVLALQNGDVCITGDFLRGWLQKANNWKEEACPAIDHYAKLLDYSNSLLAEYRQTFDEKYNELYDLYENCELDVEHQPFFEPMVKNRITIRDIREMMDSKLFVPENEYDLDKIDAYYRQWVDLAAHEKKRGFISKAIDICIIVLDEIGRRFEEDEYYASFDDYCPLEETCLNIAYILTEIMRSPDTKSSMKSYLMRKLKEVAKHSSFTDYGYFYIDDFIEDGGIYHFDDWWKPSISL